jgi:mannose-6-phosphate isomerase-like protein (cupin superfamily)
MICRDAETVVERHAWGSMRWTFAGQADGPQRLSTAFLTLSAGKAGALHRHPDCEEVLHVIAGEMALRLGGTLETLRAGDSAYVPAGEAHQVWAAGAEDAHAIVAYSAARRPYEPVAKA